MGDRTTVDARLSPHVPAPRTSPENTPRSRHRAPSLTELISTTLTVIRRDSLAPSGFLVEPFKGGAQHQHSVWVLGPFALLDDGWFGQVHGNDGDARSKWLRKHERRCTDRHWTQFRWIDASLLEAGCGTAHFGVGLSSDGPVFCPGQRIGEPHPEHVPLQEILTEGLRQLAADRG